MREGHLKGQREKRKLAPRRPVAAGFDTLEPLVPVYPVVTRSNDLQPSREPALRVVEFGGDSAVTHPSSFHVPLYPLGDGAAIEIWRTDLQPVPLGKDGLSLSVNGQVLFGSLAVAPLSGSLSAGSFHAYSTILQAIRQEGYPHLLRVWNHLSRINEDQDGLERYRSFCLGRHEAFSRFGVQPDELPAASAVGCRAEGLWIYFIASREPGIQLENPRQVSAYAYPPEYGPRPPSFARATVKRWETEWQVYLSGTASIVGHQSVHAGNLSAQLDETLANMRLLLEAASEIHHSGSADLRLLSHVKIYLRHQDDAPALQSAFLEAFGATRPFLLLEADICRKDLLIEIEGIARYPHSSG